MITIHAYRTGLTTRADVSIDGKVVISVVHMFTLKGAQREGEAVAIQLAQGKSVSEILNDDYHNRQGW